MMWVMALEREASIDDDRTWSILTFPSDPRIAPSISIGGDYTDDDGVEWRIADIFRDESK